MAAWSVLEHAATVAQLGGVDVVRLISTIMKMASTARRNKSECEQLARRVIMIAQLLPHLQDPEVMRRPEVRQPLTGLDDALREARDLVVSSQERNAACQFFMAGRLANRFSNVQRRIDSYLIVFPMVSHIAMNHRLGRLCNKLLPDDTTKYTQSLEFAMVDDAEEVIHAHGDGAKEYTFEEMKAATNNFSRNSKLGSGGTGDVYKGRLQDGREVAIKRPNNDRAQYAKEAFATEVAALSSSSLRHKHIVRLIGWCVRKEKQSLLSFRPEERLLVYEYMENGTLLEQLRNHDSSSSSVVASWRTRVEVLLGVSRAIEHMHCHAVPPVIHGDIKSSNILLDESWVPHVSDFGYSRKEKEQGIQCGVVGTLGYLDPEYLLTGCLKPTSDVYNLGVVMLEVLTGKRPAAANNLEEEEDEARSHGLTGFVSFMLPIIEAGDLEKVLDRRPGSEPTPRQFLALKLVAQTAARCVRLQGKKRPAISDVVANLEAALALIDDESGTKFQLSKIFRPYRKLSAKFKIWHLKI